MFDGLGMGGLRLAVDDTRYFACKLTIREGPFYVVMQGSELGGRNDVEVASEAFATEQEAEAAISKLGGTIPDSEGSPMFLDHFENHKSEKLWIWRDTRTWSVTQTFGSEEEALEAWRTDDLIFEGPDPNP